MLRAFFAFNPNYTLEYLLQLPATSKYDFTVF